MIDSLEFREVDNNLYALASYVLIFRLNDDDRGTSQALGDSYSLGHGYFGFAICACSFSRSNLFLVDEFSDL